MNDGARQGGLVVLAGDSLRFLPAAVALRVAQPPRVTPLPGAPPELIGLALHEGIILPVLSIGSTRGHMILCAHAGDIVAVWGGEIVATGTFTRIGGPDTVEFEGKTVPPLDIAGLYGRVQSSAPYWRPPASLEPGVTMV